MKLNFLIGILLSATIFTTACSSGGDIATGNTTTPTTTAEIGLSYGEKVAVLVAKKVKENIMNPELMKIAKVYYKQGTSTDEIRMTVSAVSQGGAPVMGDFYAKVDLEREFVDLNKKYTDLEIFVGGPSYTWSNEEYFNITDSEIEAQFEKLDSVKIDSEFRK